MRKRYIFNIIIFDITHQFTTITKNSEYTYM